MTRIEALAPALSPEELIAVVVVVNALVAAPREIAVVRDDTPVWRFSGRSFSPSRHSR